MSERPRDKAEQEKIKGSLGWMDVCGGGGGCRGWRGAGREGTGRQQGIVLVRQALGDTLKHTDTQAHASAHCHTDPCWHLGGRPHLQSSPQCGSSLHPPSEVKPPKRCGLPAEATPRTRSWKNQPTNLRIFSRGAEKTQRMSLKVILSLIDLCTHTRRIVWVKSYDWTDFYDSSVALWSRKEDGVCLWCYNVSHKWNKW